MQAKKIGTAYLILVVALFGGWVAFNFIRYTLDIHLHDTMFVFSPTLFCKIFLAYVLVLFVANYALTGIVKKVMKFQWVVYFSTFFFLICFFMDIVFSSKRFSPANIESFNVYWSYITAMEVLAFIFILLHVIFWLLTLAFVIRDIFKRN